jgi:hypothetical protein
VTFRVPGMVGLSSGGVASPAATLAIVGSLVIASEVPAASPAARSSADVHAPVAIGGSLPVCAWSGERDQRDVNVGAPDLNASYYASSVSPHAGAQEAISGEYPAARYFSFVVYKRVWGTDRLALRSADRALTGQRQPVSRTRATASRSALSAASGVRRLAVTGGGEHAVRQAAHVRGGVAVARAAHLCADRNLATADRRVVSEHRHRVGDRPGARQGGRVRDDLLDGGRRDVEALRAPIRPARGRDSRGGRRRVASDLVAVRRCRGAPKTRSRSSTATCSRPAPIGTPCSPSPTPANRSARRWAPSTPPLPTARRRPLPARRMARLPA